eukprot:TCONS_00038062-protein
MADERDRLIKRYFENGYDYKEIRATLREVHNETISTRHLHRVLRRYHLYRRGNTSDTREVLYFIESQLREGSGTLLGYRLMHLRCQQNGFNISRKNVALILKHLDPEGVNRRSRRVLKRRRYWSYGPNWVWHIDGYDKLKPYGFPIHGCIDGFSRNILWLEIASSNKDPSVVCNFYLNQIHRISGVPRKVVGDRGTENIYIAASQRFFRRNDNDNASGANSFKYGRSVSNQRIESWWSMLRRSCTNWWINFFKDLIERGSFDTSNLIECECIKFCFYPLLKQDLRATMSTWNNHRIRPSANADRRIRPAGRPNVLYTTPSISDRNIQDHKYALNQVDFETVKENYSQQTNCDYICSPEFFELSTILMFENSIDQPKDTQEALVLYQRLLMEINRI